MTDMPPRAGGIVSAASDVPDLDPQEIDVDGRPRVWTASKTALIETGDIRGAGPASVAAPNLAVSER
jgi:hypothetical protein